MLGLMQDYPLLISGLITHAARHHGSTEIVARAHDNTTHRTNWAETERRSRRLVRGQSVGCQLNNAKIERSENIEASIRPPSFLARD